AHGPVRDHLHEHHAGEDQREAGQGVRAETAHPEQLNQPGAGLREGDEGVGPGQPDEGGHDGRTEQAAGTGAEIGVGGDSHPNASSSEFYGATRPTTPTLPTVMSRCWRILSFSPLVGGPPNAQGKKDMDARAEAAPEGPPEEVIQGL